MLCCQYVHVDCQRAHQCTGGIGPWNNLFAAHRRTTAVHLCVYLLLKRLLSRLADRWKSRRHIVQNISLGTLIGKGPLKHLFFKYTTSKRNGPSLSLRYYDHLKRPWITAESIGKTRLELVDFQLPALPSMVWWGINGRHSIYCTTVCTRHRALFWKCYGIPYAFMVLV